MGWPLVFALGAGSYLLGSLPAGFLAGRLAGIDIRQHGSRNIGATNVVRVLGKRYGYAVFALDCFKGFVAVRLVQAIADRSGAAHLEYYGMAAAVLVILGHSFPVWLGFRGGKGVATGAGALLGLMPLAAIAVLLIWVTVFETSRYVSLASISAALALPLIVAILLHFGLTSGVALLYFATVMALLIVWRHRGNISRLLVGTEPRFERK